MGALAGLVGNRRVLLVVLLVFGIASLLAAFAPTPVLLIGSRVSLALGGSMIMPCVLGLIRRAFEDERAMTLGLWGTVGTAGAGLHDQGASSCAQRLSFRYAAGFFRVL